MYNYYINCRKVENIIIIIIFFATSTTIFTHTFFLELISLLIIIQRQDTFSQHCHKVYNDYFFEIKRSLDQYSNL